MSDDARIITLFSSLTNTVGAEAMVSWHELGERLRSPSSRTDEHQLTGWSPARFRDGTRLNANVVELAALCMDVDDGALSFDRLASALAPYRAYVHSTRRATAAVPRWRLVVATSRCIRRDEYALVWQFAREKLAAHSVIVDENTKDEARFWFLPVEPCEGPFVFEALEGEPLDVDAALRTLRAKKEPSGSGYGDAALKRACRTIAGSSQGERNSTLNKEAFCIAQLVAGGAIDELTASERLSAAAAAAGLRDDEIAKTLASAMSAGKQQPRGAPPLSRTAQLQTATKGVSLDVDGKGVPKKHVGNVLTVFARDERWAGVIGFDTFREAPVILRRPPQREQDAIDRKPSEWTPQDSTRTAAWLSMAYGLDVPTERVTEAMLTAAHRKPVHPVWAYLESLTWDGTPRVDTFFSTYCNTPDTPYVRGVAGVLFLSAVARARVPGEKVDTIPILESDEGNHKSTMVAILAGEWFADTAIPLGDKDAYQMLRGVWIYELAELASFKGRELTRIKSFASAKADNYRPSYEQRTRTVPRQCIFVGTTNEVHYLADPTGARRFWPVPVRNIDLEGVKRDRDQLWAEACSRVLGGERWWPSRDLALLGKREQDDRFEGDPWEAPIVEWLARPVERRIETNGRTYEDELDPNEGFTMARILRHAVGLEQNRQTKAEQARAAAILRRLGWVRDMNARHVHGDRVRLWRRAQSTPTPTLVDANIGAVSMGGVT